jgi:hypothetical protein
MISIVKMVGVACGKTYLAMIFQNIKSDISCFVQWTPPKLQNWWKIAKSKIENEIECNQVDQL